MGTGILLIHGYTGNKDDFGELHKSLVRQYGLDAVRTLCLPGHGETQPPTFDTEKFIAAITAAAIEFSDIVLIGHSTGGTLALVAISNQLPKLRLLVLIAVPNRIDSSYLARWNNHSKSGDAIAFSSLASMVSLVNRKIPQKIIGDFPVLLIHGEADDLVPCDEVHRWEHVFSGPVRTVIIPNGGHHLFRGESNRFALDLLLRAITDACHNLSGEELSAVDRLVAEEPEAASFFYRFPGSIRHLAISPSSLLLNERTPHLGHHANCEPIFANIEITTQCNLSCAFCARTQRSTTSQNMPIAVFRRILDLLPHAYRVTLVGLGEPLQHPEIADFVAEAVVRGRRVALVTNGLELTSEKSKELIKAGLHAITFSLDTAQQSTADLVRAGSDLENILANIQEFGRLADSERKLPRAIFTAVSTDTLPYLEHLIRKAASLGVDVMMMTDLNFAINSHRTLWKSGQESAKKSLRKAVRTAFSLGLPVLSVHGLEELALTQRYRRHLLVPPSQLFERSASRTHCFSPWQTIAVSVNGDVTTCDCQPDKFIGNLLENPFGELWQGDTMKKHRRQMLMSNPPVPCCHCPRF